MRVRLERRAIRQLQEIVEVIAAERPGAARGLVRRIERRLDLVAATGFVDMSRPGGRPGVREMVEPPYILSYVHDPVRDELVVVSIVHGARRR